MASLEERVEALELAVGQIALNAGKSGHALEVESAAVLLLGPDSDEEEEDEVPDATPAAEALAEAEGVDLSQVEGSGAEGRILVSDVHDAAASDES